MTIKTADTHTDGYSQTDNNKKLKTFPKNSLKNSLIWSLKTPFESTWTRN